MFAAAVRCVRENIIGWVPAVALVGLVLAGCGSAGEPAQSPTPSRTLPATAASSPQQTYLPPGPESPGLESPPFTVSTRAAPPSLLPAPPTTEASDSTTNQADRAVQGLITQNAVWHAPDFLTQDTTENIALSIGDVQRLKDEIDATVPTDVPRSPLPVDVTVGTVVRAKLSVISSDATVTPLDTIDKSISDQVSLLFSWQIHPHVAGELNLQAIISCPRADGSVTTENVPLRILVHPVVKPTPPPPPPPPPPSLGDRVRGFFDLLQKYWVQLTAAGGVLAAAGRFVWRWHSRRREHEQGTASGEPDPDSDKACPDTDSETTAVSPAGPKEDPAAAALRSATDTK